MTQTEALKLALEALELSSPAQVGQSKEQYEAECSAHYTAIRAVRDAHAQPEQESESVRHWSDCATNNRGCPELLGPCDCGGIPPKPEPVAWLLEFVDEDNQSRRDVFYEQRHLQQHVEHNTSIRGLTCKTTPLYITPPSNSMNSIKSSNTLDAQRKPLTDEEIPEGVLLAIQRAGLTLVMTAHGYHLMNLGLIEAAHGIKGEA